MRCALPRRNMALAALAALACLVAMGFVGDSHAQEAQPQTMTGAGIDAGIDASIDAARLEQINQGLKALPPQSGRFEQILPNGGMAEGRYLMDWPARLRFAYEGQRGGSVVTVKGKFVAVQETPGAEPNWFPVALTPLAVLRQAVADGIERAMLVEVQTEPAFIALSLRDPSGELPGTATLYFTRPDLQLYAWRLIDVQNVVTQVRLRDRKIHKSLSDSLFDIEYDDVFDD